MNLLKITKFASSGSVNAGASQFFEPDDAARISVKPKTYNMWPVCVNVLFLQEVARLLNVSLIKIQVKAVFFYIIPIIPTKVYLQFSSIIQINENHTFTFHWMSTN